MPAIRKQGHREACRNVLRGANRGLIWMLLLLLASCDNLAPEEPTIQPGAFSLSRIPTSSSIRSGSSSVYKHSPGKASTSFDLGEISNTADFYFVLTNAGQTDITNIVLISENPKFQISPAKIDVLEPLEKIALHQVLKVTAVHGTAPSGVGLAPVMPPGPNSTVLSIQGMTANDEGDSLAVGIDATLRIDAKLVDVRISDAIGEVDLTTPSYSVMYSRVTNENISGYDTVPGKMTVENTGSANLRIAAYRYNYPLFEQIASTDLEAGASIELNRSTGETLFLRIDGSNTISDQKRLPIYNDGMIYLAFWTKHVPPPGLDRGLQPPL